MRAAAAALLGAACAGGYAAAPTAAPAPATTAVTYAPGVVHYRGASYLHVEQRVGDQDQPSNTALVYYVTAAIEAGGEPWRVTFTVDSVPDYVTGAPGAAGTDLAEGATFVGALARDGTLRDLASGDSGSRLLAQLGEQLRRFYAKIPAAGIVPGSRWTDTTQTTTRGGGVPLTMTAVSEHAVAVAIDTLDSPALPIRTLTSYTFTGTGSQGGQPFSVQGNGRRHAVELMSLTGRFLGLVAADTSSFTIALPATDLSIPGHQTRADTISVIP